MSEREDWINLIRDEYDPRPNLGKADYSGFEWDDGTGRIADAIMADKVLALREAADRIEALEAALREAVKIAKDFDCRLGGYPSEEAQSYYEGGVIDASRLIAEHIAALAPEPDK